MSTETIEYGSVVRELPFRMQPQLREDWCWAAVAFSVARFFADRAGCRTRWTQPDVAERVLRMRSCERAGTCNRQAALDRALRIVGHLRSISGPAKYERLVAEIDAGRPIAVRTTWHGRDDDAHFLVLAGYGVRDGVRHVEVRDSAYGASSIAVESFATGYRGKGVWTDTYFLRPRASCDANQR